MAGVFINTFLCGLWISSLAGKELSSYLENVNYVLQSERLLAPRETGHLDSF